MVLAMLSSFDTSLRLFISCKMLMDTEKICLLACRTCLYFLLLALKSLSRESSFLVLVVVLRKSWVRGESGREGDLDCVGETVPCP